MTRVNIRKMVLDILGHADYDLMESFLPETAEEPEYAEEQLEKLIDVAEKHLQKK